MKPCHSFLSEISDMRTMKQVNKKRHHFRETHDYVNFISILSSSLKHKLSNRTATCMIRHSLTSTADSQSDLLFLEHMTSDIDASSWSNFCHSSTRLTRSDWCHECVCDTRSITWQSTGFGPELLGRHNCGKFCVPVLLQNLLKNVGH